MRNSIPQHRLVDHSRHMKPRKNKFWKHTSNQPAPKTPPLGSRCRRLLYASVFPRPRSFSIVTVSLPLHYHVRYLIPNRTLQYPSRFLYLRLPIFPTAHTSAQSRQSCTLRTLEWRFLLDMREVNVSCIQKELDISDVEVLV